MSHLEPNHLMYVVVDEISLRRIVIEPWGKVQSSRGSVKVMYPHENTLFSTLIGIHSSPPCSWKSLRFSPLTINTFTFVMFKN